MQELILAAYEMSLGVRLRDSNERETRYRRTRDARKAPKRKATVKAKRLAA